MKAYNLTSNNGNKVPNQLEIIDNNGTKYFQSYNSIIIKQTTNNTYLDSYYYNYSRTTSKYRNLYLDRITIVGPNEKERRWMTFNV